MHYSSGLRLLGFQLWGLAFGYAATPSGLISGKAHSFYGLPAVCPIGALSASLYAGAVYVYVCVLVYAQI